MSFQGLQATYRRLFQESTAWRLLRVDNAPLILAFIADLFAEETQVPFGRARVALDTELTRCRELGIWETETPAATYLNQWIRAGWLREMDDELTRTDACEVALRFCQSLDQRCGGTTASHLKIVQEAVRDFSIALSPNPAERVNALEAQKAELQREIDALNAGVVIELTEVQQRERIREIYQLASVLTGDFRRVEDEIRELAQSIRIQIIEDGAERGAVLSAVMKKEAVLAGTDAGSAFEGFFQLLCDQNRTAEFRDQIRRILNSAAAEQLLPSQKQFLARLMRELARESDRVFQVRRRTEEGLRAYIESGEASENRVIDQLLSQLERKAIALQALDVSPAAATTLTLPVGAIKISSPDAMRPRAPDETLDTSDVADSVNSRIPDRAMLSSLDTVQVKTVALRTQQTLLKHGPMTLAAVIAAQPVQAGLEELVACLRVARAVKATQLDDRENVEIMDKQGVRLNASIPKYLLSAELFPDNPENLVV
ncbi:MAG: DUF3375 domain-containing protein [Pontibacterium sp.]